MALWQISSEADSVVSILTELLGDNDGNIRMAAAEVLEKIGPQAQTAIPALTKALQDEHKGVREAAAEALGKIDKKK